MRIGIDLDNVCYPFVEVFRLYAEHQLSKRLPPITRWNFYEDWGMTGREFADMMRDGHDAGLVFKMGTPSSGCSAALMELSTHHEVVLITSRPAYADFATYDWVDRWQIPHHDLIITDDKTQHGLDVLLDDAPHLIEAAREAGIAAYVWDKPWNASVLTEPRERIRKWRHFLETV